MTARGVPVLLRCRKALDGRERAQQLCSALRRLLKKQANLFRVRASFSSARGWMSAFVMEIYMPKKLILAAAALVMATVTVPAEAQRYARWETVGSLRVNNRFERDEVRVRGNDRHRAIRLCNTNSRKDIRLVDVDVMYANGREEDIPNQDSIRAGRCTPAYDLLGNSRNIRAVKLAYAKMGVRGRDPILTVQAR
jgi:hypothetical protein